MLEGEESKSFTLKLNPPPSEDVEVKIEFLQASADTNLENTNPTPTAPIQEILKDINNGRKAGASFKFQGIPSAADGSVSFPYSAGEPQKELTFSILPDLDLYPYKLQWKLSVPNSNYRDRIFNIEIQDRDVGQIEGDGTELLLNNITKNREIREFQYPNNKEQSLSIARIQIKLTFIH